VDSNLRQQIYNHMSLLDSQELVEIWQKNDRVLWSSEAFEVIQEVLLERGNNLPLQGEPILEYIEESDDSILEDEDLPELIDEAEEPEFYKPKEILWLKKWLMRASIGTVIVTVVSGLLGLPNLHTTIYSFVNRSEWNLAAWVLAFVTFLILTGIQSAILYFAINSLGYLLTILMQTEFNSRGVKPTGT
jgi:hypothetical protein